MEDEKSEGPKKVMVKHNVLEGSCHFCPILGARVYRVDNVLLVHSEVVNGQSMEWTWHTELQRSRHYCLSTGFMDGEILVLDLGR